jgi:hypothetical protein
MSPELRSDRSGAPEVVARLAEHGTRPDPDAVRAAMEAGAVGVEVPLAVLETHGATAGVTTLVAVADAASARRAIDRGAGGLRITAPGAERDELVALAEANGVAAHVPIGRGVPEAAFVDVGDLDPDAGDDLVGRLAALADLAAAGRSVIASIGPVGPDATATLAALATDRGAAVLRVVEVAAAVRAAAVSAAVGAPRPGRSR